MVQDELTRKYNAGVRACLTAFAIIHTGSGVRQCMTAYEQIKTWNLDALDDVRQKSQAMGPTRPAYDKDRQAFELHARLFAACKPLQKYGREVSKRQRVLVPAHFAQACADLLTIGREIEDRARGKIQLSNPSQIEPGV